MIALLKLINAGLDAGPFNLYSNVDGYTTAFKSNVSRAELTSPLGYSIAAPYNTTIVRIKSTGVCPSIIDITLSPYNCSFIANTTETIIIEPPVVSIPTVTIGTQTWMTKNLDVSTYRDGTPIPQATTREDWSTGKFPTSVGRYNKMGSWCYYNNTVSNGTTYGKLYNWWAMKGIYDAASLADPNLRKKIAPLGYHVPTQTEWNTLINNLGGNTVAGAAMKTTGTKEAGTGLWKTPNSGATNSSGFSALPGGILNNYDTSFGNIHEIGWFWFDTDGTYGYQSFWGDGVVLQLPNTNTYANTITYASKNSGVSIRLIKD
jgi:uncharacterized protein (TIGR02145 family)